MTYGVLGSLVSSHPVSISHLHAMFGVHLNVDVPRVSDREKGISRCRRFGRTKIVDETEYRVVVADSTEFGVVGTKKFALRGVTLFPR